MSNANTPTATDGASVTSGGAVPSPTATRSDMTTKSAETERTKRRERRKFSSEEVEEELSTKFEELNTKYEAVRASMVEPTAQLARELSDLYGLPRPFSIQLADDLCLRVYSGSVAIEHDDGHEVPLSDVSGRESRALLRACIKQANSAYERFGEEIRYLQEQNSLLAKQIAERELARSALLEKL
jgi:hypothetical protein